MYEALLHMKIKINAVTISIYTVYGDIDLTTMCIANLWENCRLLKANPHYILL